MSGAWLNRAVALFIFGGVEYAAELLMPLVPRNEFYYAFCVIFGLAEVVLSISLLDACDLSLDLIKLCFIQMFFQFMGFVIYETRLPVEIYNYSIKGIVWTTFLRILLSWWIDGNSPRHLGRGLSGDSPFLDSGDNNGISS